MRNKDCRAEFCECQLEEVEAERDQWKQKAGELQARLDTIQVLIRDLAKTTEGLALDRKSLNRSENPAASSASRNRNK